MARGDTVDLGNVLNEGGIFSGWDITGESINGSGGEADRQHDFQPQLAMPNLSDLTMYEQMAKAYGSTVTVGGATLVSAVLGDDVSEKQHLYLKGTEDDPIVLNGPVVVYGSVIISGVVSGQGSIYAKKVFIPDNLQYSNPPSTPIPASMTESGIETWIEENLDKDALGLFAQEHIVVGDYTNTSDASYVMGWLADSQNKSEEDAGEDNIPNTASGKDGIADTADDDVLEDDDTWTVETYQEGDYIPDGKEVGDIIPGSGEDIDGDGVQDATTQITELYLPAALTAENWQGLDEETSYESYSEIATNLITKLEAALYTNHTLAMMISEAGDFQLNGAMISRNEAVVLGGNTFTINYDARLLVDGENTNFYLPRTWGEVEVLGWIVSE